MKIAFIGLGAMGLPMARRLATVGGADVVACDIDAGRLALAAEFASTTTSIAEAVAGAEAIFTVLPADQHVHAVVEELAHHVSPGQVYIDFSTIGPATITDAASRFADLGVATVSMALTRSTAAAQAGELVLFAGGLDDELADRFREPFEAMAIDVRRTAGIPGAKALKLANNMIIACIDVAVCEALVLGESLGATAEEVVAALRRNGADSWALVNHIEKYVLPDDLGPGRFSTRYMAKDVQLFSRMALDVGVPAVLAGLVSAQYRGTVAIGLGDHYHMIVKRWQESAAGRHPSTPNDVPVPPSETDLPRELDAIGRALAGIQLLATDDGLAACEATGVPRTEAAAHLLGGSAGNDYLATVAADAPYDGPDHQSMVDGLDRVIDLSEDLAVPSLCYETARRLLRAHLPA